MTFLELTAACEGAYGAPHNRLRPKPACQKLQRACAQTRACQKLCAQRSKDLHYKSHMQNTL